MFEDFTVRARQAAETSAEQQARVRSHDWIGTEHLLLGLNQDGDGTAVKTLNALGNSMPAAQARIDDILGPGQRTPRPGPLPHTPRSRRVLELAGHEANRLGHRQVSTGHILLALIRESDGIAGQVLAAQGADLATAR